MMSWLKWQPTGQWWAGLPWRKRIALAAIAVLVVSAVALLVTGGTDADDAGNTDAPARETERGFTDQPTMPYRSTTGGVTPTPRPDELPPLIVASKACKALLDEARDLMDADPYGMTASVETVEALTPVLTKIHDGSVCTGPEASGFNVQEYAPWQTWTDPAQETGLPPYQLPAEKTAEHRDTQDAELDPDRGPTNNKATQKDRQ